MEAVFYCFIGSKIDKIDKIANNKNLLPPVFGDSRLETKIFFTWP